MRRSIASGITAGTAASAFVTSVVEPFFCGGFHGAAPRVAAIGLVLPVGFAIGLTAIFLRSLLPEQSRPVSLLKRIFGKPDPRLAGRIFIVGAISPFLLLFFYHLIFFFLTSFHHAGLSALFLTACLLLSVALIYFIGGRIISAVCFLLEKPLVRLSFLSRPAFASAFFVASWAVALIPPLLRGPDAPGVFGFIGFLTKDGLGAGPLLSMGSIFLTTGLLLIAVLRLKNRVLYWVAAFCLVLDFGGPLATDALFKKLPKIRDEVDSCEGLSFEVGKMIRKLTDRDGDGYATAMGGRDCNDANPSIYPGAREIMDNDIDEDCNGADLKSVNLKSTLEQSERGETSEVEALKKPAFPEDVSLFLITVDTLRWNAPGFMGYNRPITPNLDKLVEDGTIYNRAYSIGSYTAQSIPPLMTGKYPSELLRNDRHETRVSGKETFAAELVCKGEIKCKAILSHFLFEPYFGWNQGFEDWEVVGGSPSGPEHIDSKYNSHSVATQAIKWLENPENTKGRFWLWVHFMDPHKEYLQHSGFTTFGDSRRDKYDHEVLFTDYHIGRMLDVFYKLPAAKRTIVAVTSDHGEAFNEHGRLCHGKELWEEIIRVPMAFTGPGITRKKISRQTSQIDIFPTILDIFGVPIPARTHGRSLLPDWVEGQEMAERPVVTDQPRNPNFEARRTFTYKGWKLHVLRDTGDYRFFRLTDDYEQGDSLADSETEAFNRILSSYEMFCASELKSADPVDYTAGPVGNMPLPSGYLVPEESTSQMASDVSSSSSSSPSEADR